MYKFIMLLSLIVTVQGQTKTLNVCQQMISQAEEQCDKIMCEEQGIATCERDGDFHEGFGICVYDEVLPALVKKHNEASSSKKIDCDSDGNIVTDPVLSTFSCKANEGKATFYGTVYQDRIEASIHDSAKELKLKGYKSSQPKIVFNVVGQNKGTTYFKANFYTKLNVLQNIEFSFPKSTVDSEKTAKFNGVFTVYNSKGNILAPAVKTVLSCLAN